jgi:hypothetical protein
MAASVLLLLTALSGLEIKAQSVRAKAPDSLELCALVDSVNRTWQGRGHLLARTSATALGPLVSWTTDPGPQLFWRQLLTSGDTTYTQAALLRLARIRTGDTATPTSLKEGIDRILAPGCAELDAPPQWRGQRGTTWADAWLPLASVPCSQASAVLGWDNSHGLQGQVDVELANLMGTARSGSLVASAKGEDRNFELQWHEPWLGNWDVGLDASASLQETSIQLLRRAEVQSLWPAPEGTWVAGLEGWIDISGAVDSTVQTQAFGTKVGWKWKARPHPDWLHPPCDIDVSTTTLQTGGTSEPWLASSQAKMDWGWSTGDATALAVRFVGQAVLPLDTSDWQGESHPLGGSSDWKGHQEGQFQSAQWAVGELELRAGAGDWGAAAFFDPGVVWILYADGPRPHPGYGAGAGMHWIRSSEEVRLDLAVGEDTRSWQDALLHLSVQSRF